MLVQQPTGLCGPRVHKETHLVQWNLVQMPFITEQASTESCERLLYRFSTRGEKQDAQLSQRDRAAGCIIVFGESRRLELGDNILQTL